MSKYKYRIKQAAIYTGVSVSTLRRWDESGRLKAFRIDGKGNRRYSQEDLDNALKFMEHPESNKKGGEVKASVDDDFQLPRLTIRR